MLWLQRRRQSAAWLKLTRSPRQQCNVKESKWDAGETWDRVPLGVSHLWNVFNDLTWILRESRKPERKQHWWTFISVSANQCNGTKKRWLKYFWVMIGKIGRKAAVHSQRTTVSHKVLMGFTLCIIDNSRIWAVNFNKSITYSVSSALLRVRHSIYTALSFLSPAGRQPTCHPGSLPLNVREITDSRI